MKASYITVFFLFSFLLHAQRTPQERIITGTATIGLSAISLSTLVAKTYKALYPYYTYGADSATGSFLFSTRQKTEGGVHHLSKGFIGNLNMDKDSIEWVFESNYYELTLGGEDLFFSNELKTTKYNRLHGFVEYNYPNRLLYILPNEHKTLLYPNAEKNVLNCVNIEDGTTYWNAIIPKEENWVDARKGRNSHILVAAAGLHALSSDSGLLWSYPLTTSIKITQALTYSPASMNPALKKVSQVAKTSGDEKIVTELASNILEDERRIYFAGNEKMITVDPNGKLLWELDLKEYPVSKMLLVKRGGALMLVNLGLAQYGDNYVLYGSPFVLNIDAESGKVNYRIDISAIENLIDFKMTKGSMIFAGKKTLLEVRDGSSKADTLFDLNINQYGSFSGFIDGDAYYTEKEGFYVALNFIDDNVIYFKADNNKVYTLEKNTVKYAYHFTEIYLLEQKIDNKLILANEDKTLIVSSNFDLLCTLDLADKPVAWGRRIFFVGDQMIYSLDVGTIK